MTTANIWRRCHLPIVVGVLLEKNLGIFTEVNCCYLHLNLPLWVTNEGRGARSYRAVVRTIPVNSRHQSNSRKRYLMTLNVKGSIVVFSISKSVEPNEERKVLI